MLNNKQKLVSQTLSLIISIVCFMIIRLVIIREDPFGFATIVLFGVTIPFLFIFFDKLISKQMFPKNAVIEQNIPLKTKGKDFIYLCLTGLLIAIIYIAMLFFGSMNK